MLTVWIVRKRNDTGRHSYRGDLLEQAIDRSKKKKPPSKSDSREAENLLTGDTVLNQITGDSYLADLLRKERKE